MKRSSVVEAALLAAVAALVGCGNSVDVFEDTQGNCIDAHSGGHLDLRACSGSGNQYYNGVHYHTVLLGSGSRAGASESSGTVRGVFGGSAGGDGGGE